MDFYYYTHLLSVVLTRLSHFHSWGCVHGYLTKSQVWSQVH